MQAAQGVPPERTQVCLNASVRVKRLMSTAAGCLAVVVGANGLASLPFAYAYQMCVADWTTDGQIWRADVDISTRLLPYSLHCSYANGVVETHGPGLGALLAWAVAVAIALIATVRYRRAAAVRGLASSVAVLAAYGYLAEPLGFEFGWAVATVVGAPIVYGIDRGLRVRADRRLHSCLLALVLPAVVLLSWWVAWAFEQHTVGVLIAVLIGAGTAALIERVESLEEYLRPARHFLADPP